MVHKLQQKAASENQKNLIKLEVMKTFAFELCAPSFGKYYTFGPSVLPSVGGCLCLFSRRAEEMSSSERWTLTCSFTGTVAANLWDPPVLPCSLIEDQPRFC